MALGVGQDLEPMIQRHAHTLACCRSPSVAPVLLGILHYDADYDLLDMKTDLLFDSVWLASRGTL